ncbi:MAG: M48 family metalloprotease, partial [Rhodobacteraceae bacterium]|nr:M48 family metalloprotease [Paracoccaceae bacterium]
AIAILLGLLGVLMLAPRASKEMLFSMYKARRLTARDFPEAINLLETLSRRAGLPRAPALYYVPSAAPNAFAVGSLNDSAVGVSDGLLRMMSHREFAGVLAHEISHIAHNDLWIMGLADAMTRLTSLMSYAGQFILLASIPLLLLGQPVISWWAPLALVLSPTVVSLLQLALSRTREFDADRGGAELTGDALGLASALAKLERRQGRFWEEIILPGRRIPQPSLLRTHPPTAERITRLKAFAAAHPEARPLESVAAFTAPTLAQRPPAPPRLHWTGLWY